MYAVPTGNDSSGLRVSTIRYPRGCKTRSVNPAAIAVVSLLLARPPAPAGSPLSEAPFPPHRIADNLYYVGSEGLASYLVTTRKGHILINPSFDTTVPVIRASVEKLGFKFTDVEDPAEQPRPRRSRGRHGRGQAPDRGRGARSCAATTGPSPAAPDKPLDAHRRHARPEGRRQGHPGRGQSDRAADARPHAAAAPPG